jgi:hypothetical protein
MFVRLKEKRDIRKNKVEKYIYWKKGFSVKNISIEKKIEFESTITGAKGVCIFHFCLASQ